MKVYIVTYLYNCNGLIIPQIKKVFKNEECATEFIKNQEDVEKHDLILF